MRTSKIEWTGRSDWNPVRGCSRVTEACRNCYAEIMAARFSDPGMWGHGFAHRVDLPGGGMDHRWTGKVELQEDRLTKPLRWRKASLVFPNSTSDFFHEKLPFEAIDKLFAVMSRCPHLTFQILTKRPERARDYIVDRGRVPSTTHNGMALIADICSELGHEIAPAALRRMWPLPNVWIGTSVHDQDSADKFIPELLATPAALHFISYEPALGPLDISLYLNAYWTAINCPQPKQPDGSWTGRRIEWAICGGESGHDARPMHPNWGRSLRDQCKEAGVPFFFKQWGEYAPTRPPEYATHGIFENGHCYRSGHLMGATDTPAAVEKELERENGQYTLMSRYGKGAAGSLLDGREHKEFPSVKKAEAA